MTPTTSKRVVLYRFSSAPVEGHMNPTQGLQEGHVEMITTAGTLQRARYEEVKAICVSTAGAKANLFVEDSAFERRPKMAGLWVRFSLRDGDRLEGILGNNLLDWPEHGYWITPPHAGPGRQRVFLARRALSSAEVLGVIGAKRLPATKEPLPGLDQQQLPMFPE